MLEPALNTIDKAFLLEPVDVGEFAQIKKGFFSIRVDCYNAKGLGRVSTVQSVAMAGLMKMDTLIVNPFELDVPLFSLDIIRAMGKQTLLLELYDTTLDFTQSLCTLEKVKDRLLSVANYDLGEKWYDHMKMSPSLAKRGGKKDFAALNRAADEFLFGYISLATDATSCDKLQKKRKSGEYVEGLLQNGGPSTDAFAKLLGKDKTALLFRKFVFGTQD